MKKDKSKQRQRYRFSELFNTQRLGENWCVGSDVRGNVSALDQQWVREQWKSPFLWGKKCQGQPTMCASKQGEHAPCWTCRWSRAGQWVTLPQVCMCTAKTCPTKEMVWNVVSKHLGIWIPAWRKSSEKNLKPATWKKALSSCLHLQMVVASVAFSRLGLLPYSDNTLQ